MNIQNVIGILKSFEYPWVLLIIIPIPFILYFLLRKDFIQLKEEDIVRRRRKLTQKIVVLTRTLIFLLIIIAIASPFYQRDKIIEGDPILKILIDNSTSMRILESAPVSLIEQLKDKVEVEIGTIGNSETSDLGDAILNTLEPYQSLLLISDGNANKGSDLGDVAAYANQINSTVHALKLKETSTDVAVTISGPAKAMQDVENTFIIQLHKVGKTAMVPLIVIIDDQVVFDESTAKTEIEIKKTFSDGGFHRITARINLQDFYVQNNEFFKTVKVVPRPKIVFYDNDGISPLIELLRQVFDVEITNTPPKLQGSNYYGAIINDIDATQLKSSVDDINEYVSDGNGLLVVGGEKSYNYGNYRGSMIESILPVFVGKPGKKESDVNIVVVLDISGSMGDLIGIGTALDISKGLAFSVLSGLKKDNRLGIVAFNSQAYTVEELSYIRDKTLDFRDTLARLKDGGGTVIAAGLLKAISMLQYVEGSKNIILLSDGRTKQENQAYEAAKLAANEGIKIYTVGVGDVTNEDVMTAIADLTNGIFFRASESNRIKILFGEPDKPKDSTESRPGVRILNSNHFITEGTEQINALLSGYNEVVPKTTARFLIATTNGDPVLTVWRLGLGRIASLSTDDGTQWAGQLLAADNSRVLIRTVNWILGEPDRKVKSGATVSDTRVNEQTELIIKSDQQPVAGGVTFYKIDENTFSTSITPVKTGFNNVLDATFAANYPKEYETLGFSQALSKTVQATKGSVFSAEEVQKIIDETKTRSKRTVNSREVIRWPFVIFAIIIFLTEIFMRRWLRKD